MRLQRSTHYATLTSVTSVPLIWLHWTYGSGHASVILIPSNSDFQQLYFLMKASKSEQHSSAESAIIRRYSPLTARFASISDQSGRLTRLLTAINKITILRPSAAAAHRFQLGPNSTQTVRLTRRWSGTSPGTFWKGYLMGSSAQLCRSADLALSRTIARSSLGS